MASRARLVLMIATACAIAGCSRSASREITPSDPNKAAALRWQQGRLIEEAKAAGLYTVKLRDGRPELWLEKLASDTPTVKQEAARIVFEYHCGEALNCEIAVFDDRTGKQEGFYSRSGYRLNN